MFGALGEVQIWAALSVPVCAFSALRAANTAALYHVDAPPVRTGGVAALLIIVAMILIVVSRSSSIEAIAVLVLLSGLVYLTIFDMRFMATSILLCGALAALGVLSAFYVGGLESSLTHAAAAVSGWIGFHLLSVAYSRFAKRDGLGLGDAWIAAILGAWLSFEGMAWAIVFGCGASWLWLKLRHWPSEKPFPLAPGLVFGVLVVLLLEAVMLELGA